MPFPISLSGTVDVSGLGLTTEQAIDRLESALAAAKATSLHRTAGGLHFRGGALRLVSSWNILVPISTGILEVTPEQNGVSIRYGLKFTQMLVAVTAVVAGIFGPVVASSRGASISGVLSVLLVLWSWLFGGNYVLTVWRFPRFLTKSISRPLC